MTKLDDITIATEEEYLLDDSVTTFQEHRSEVRHDLGSFSAEVNDLYREIAKLKPNKSIAFRVFDVAERTAQAFVVQEGGTGFITPDAKSEGDYIRFEWKRGDSNVWLEVQSADEGSMGFRHGTLEDRFSGIYPRRIAVYLKELIEPELSYAESELSSLLDDMQKGNRLRCSAEMRSLAQRIANQTASATDIDIDTWASNLASDVADAED